MDTHGDTATQTLPWSVWALAWSSVVGQVLTLLRHGVKDDPDWVGSAILGVAVVTFLAHGVLRARRARFWLVYGLLVVGAVVQLLLVPADLGAVLDLVLVVVHLGLLELYRRSAWFRWQRTRPAGGPSLVPILLLAVVVGVLAGVIEQHDTAIDMRIRTRF